jgi:hypothetical protein
MLRSPKLHRDWLHYHVYWSALYVCMHEYMPMPVRADRVDVWIDIDKSTINSIHKYKMKFE